MTTKEEVLVPDGGDEAEIVESRVREKSQFLRGLPGEDGEHEGVGMVKVVEPMMAVEAVADRMRETGEDAIEAGEMKIGVLDHPIPIGPGE